MSTTHSAGITDQSVRLLVERFYDRVRADPALAGVFAGEMSDAHPGEAHLDEFWSSFVGGTASRGGYPVQLHLRHAGQLTPDLFRRWLSMWRTSMAEMASPTPAASIRPTATRVAGDRLPTVHIHQRPAAATYADPRTA